MSVGRQVFRCGGLGSGHAMKALANYVNAGALVNLIEALAIGRKFGARKPGDGGRLHPHVHRPPASAGEEGHPAGADPQFTTGMALGLIAKDVSIAANFGHAIGAMTPLADRVLEIWRKGEADIGGTADQTEIARLWEEGNGIRL